MPILRSGRVTENFQPEVQEQPENIKMADHINFRTAFDQVKADAVLLFPGENEVSHREDFIKMHREALLKQFGFFPTNATHNSTEIIKNFVATSNKFDSKTESVSEFFDRIDRKFTVDNISDTEKIALLDILLPNHYYLPYEPEKTAAEQYLLYKQRALVKSKCTPIDMLYKYINITFNSDENFEQIFSKCKYSISKCLTLFPDVEKLDIMTWLFLLKSFPKHTRIQLSNECRTPNISDLPATLQRFASHRNCTLGSLLYDQKQNFNNSSKTPFIKKENESKIEKSFQSTKEKPSKIIPQCEYCKKRGHLEQDCFLKYPAKKKTNPSTVNNTVSKENPNRGVEFLLPGKINL